MSFFSPFGRELHSVRAGFSGVTVRREREEMESAALGVSAQPLQTLGRRGQNAGIPVFSSHTCSKTQPHHELPVLAAQGCPNCGQGVGSAR